MSNESFEELFGQHLPSLRRYFRNKVASRADEDALIQCVLTHCIEVMQGSSPPPSFRTFLFQVARNELRDYYRGRRRGGGSVPG